MKYRLREEESEKTAPVLEEGAWSDSRFVLEDDGNSTEPQERVEKREKGLPLPHRPPPA